MRKVQYNGSKPGEIKYGLFHGWGFEAAEGSYNQPGNTMWSVAIIEDSDGQVHLISADRIKFTESPI